MLTLSVLSPRSPRVQSRSFGSGFFSPFDHKAKGSIMGEKYHLQLLSFPYVVDEKVVTTFQENEGRGYPVLICIPPLPIFWKSCYNQIFTDVKKKESCIDLFHAAQSVCQFFTTGFTSLTGNAIRMGGGVRCPLYPALLMFKTKYRGEN